ncbi:MAG: Ig-like domain-containing protein, partial [Acidobacteriaceae bacterium]|nr:Ig-like domain-containing protein [Acidobacteriaceae bacterium]
MPGSLVQIAVGFAGNVWGINASESIYRFDTSAQRWKQIPGWLGQIAVGLNGDVWGINPWNSIYRFDPATNTWQNIPGSLRELSIGADGAVWGVNAEGQVYQYNAQAQSWSQMPGQLSKVAVGSSNHVWGLDSAGQALRFDPTNQNWDSTSVTLSQISVGFDGTAWGINSAGQIYRFDSQVASWQQVGGALSQIASPDDGLVWGLNPASSIYEFLLPPSTLVESATAPLQVVGTSPVNAQVGVSVQQSISIEFNEAIDPGTIGPNGFSLIDSNGNQIPVQYSYDAGVPQVTLTPTALLIPSSSYTVTVGASVHSLTGIAIPANFSMEFTTAAPMQVSGTVVPPPGVDPSTLTVVGFREQESAPDSTGTFTTGIDEVGPTLLTTPLPTTSAALMAVALRDTTSALNQPTSTGRMARLKPLAKHVHPHQITASTSGGDGIGMDFQTTAETVLFDSAALFNRDPEIASSLLGVIAADPNTAALASAIQNASSQPHPFQAPAVTSAYTTALRSVLSTLTQNNQSMSTSTQSRTRPAISPTPKDVATNPRPADQSGSSTTADYTSIDATSDLNVKPFVLNGSTYTAPVGVPGPHPNPFNFSPGSAVGWMMRVTQLPSGWDTSTLRADAVNGNPQNPDSPVTQPGEGTAYPIQSGLWIPSNSIWKYKDIVDDEVQLSNALWNTITGQTNTEDAGSQIAIPATTGNSYLVRYYSGGFSDPDELALVSGDSAIPNGKTLWRTALAANLLIPVFELLPIPDPDVSCLIDGNTLVQVAADANLAGPPTLSDFPRIAMDLYNGIRNNVTNCGLDAGVQGTLTSKLEELGTDAAADAEEDIAQLVKSAGSFGQEAQAILQLAGEDSPVDTAYVTVGTPTGTQVARVVINPDTVSVATNQSATATATAYDAYQNVISGATFQWTSANSSVASIGETSANSITISGGAGGTTTITATAPGGISGSATVNVSSSGPAAHFTMTAQSQTAPDGGTLNLAVPVNGSVTVNFSSTSMPGGAPIATYIWQSNGSTICQNSSTCSLAFGTPSNSITLIVKDADGNSSTATGQVNVKIGGLQITAVSPSNVSTGSNNQTITVTGAGFQSGLTVPISYPGGSGVLSGSQIQSVTSTSFQVLVTFNNPGTYTISVTNPNGSTSNTAQITATSRGPTISQVSPSSVSTGSGNQTITVTGSNFQSGLTVPISYPGGSGVLSGSQIQSVTSTSFQVLITFNNPGTYTISAKNPDGSTSNTAQITATSPGPTISQVSPSSVSTGSGNQTITVTGSNFQSGLTVPISYPGGSGV